MTVLEASGDRGIPRPRRWLPQVLRESGILAGRALRELGRAPTRFCFPVVVPVVQLVMFGEIFARLAELPGFGAMSTLHFQAAGAVVLSVMAAIGGAGFQMQEDLTSGFLDRLRTTPTPRESILFGLLAADAVRLGLQALVVLLVALALGAPLVTGVLGALAIATLAGLVGACWSGLSVIVALRTRSAEATAASTLFIFPLYFASTAFMPEALLPGYLQQADRFNPVNLLIVAVRTLMLDGWMWGPVLRAGAAGLVVAALTLPFAVSAFRDAAA